MNNRSIIPECYADTLLVSLIGFKGANHALGIGEVSRLMQKNYKTRLAIGVIDADKTQPKYFDKFESIKRVKGLEHKKHPDFNHHIIVVKPAFEKWIFAAANAVDVEPSKYGFKTEKYFKNVSKNVNVSSNDNFKQFINTINQKKSEPTETLKNWIEELLNT